VNQPLRLGGLLQEGPQGFFRGRLGWPRSRSV
jgi:hypothetical protein